MTKKRIIMMLVIMIVAVLLTVAFVFLWKDYQENRKLEQEKTNQQNAAGCHIVDDKLYAHFAGDCYVFREKDDELVVLTYLAMDGYQTDDTFQGTLSLYDFQHSEEGFIEGTPMVSKLGDFYTVLDRKTCRHNETDEAGNNKMVTHFTDYEFTYYVYPENPSFLAVIIYEHLLDDYHIGILANSEAEARQYYQWFKENEPKNTAE